MEQAQRFIVVDTPDSKAVRQIRYDTQEEILTTTFPDGKVWEYFLVSRTEFERVAHPGDEFGYSVGRAFHVLIRKVKTGRPL